MYTSHGHHIEGTVKDGPALGPVERCGGPGLCDSCSQQAIRYGHIDRAETTVKHPSLKYFMFDHLPMRLQSISAPFYNLASHLDRLPNGDQKNVAFQKLIEAKDAAVRAAL